MSLVDDLKARARALHRAAQRGDTSALERLRVLPELRSVPHATLADAVKRRHCLAAIARELGFGGWPHAAGVLAGGQASDYGTLLYPPHASGQFHVWSAAYDEARAIRAEHGGYLLAYKRHFFIVDAFYIETLGLDPEDADWARIDRDWPRPTEPEARTRLYAKLIGAVADAGPPSPR